MGSGAQWTEGDGPVSEIIASKAAPEPEAVVCDTDALSFLFNRDPIRGPKYEQHLDKPRVVLPAAVVAVLLFGAEQRNWGAARKLRLERFIRRYEIQYPNYAICEIWAEIRATLWNTGIDLKPQDAWVAATALYLDLPLVTHNVRHFRAVDRLHILTEPD